MTAKKRPKPKAYRVVTGVRNDETGKAYPAGSIVTAKDFSADLLVYWAAKGVLDEV